MKDSKRKKLEAAGWRVGSASDFLGLSPEEEALVAMKLALAADIKERRRAQGMTQHVLARRIGSSQSRIAKMEVADKSVSMELLVRSLTSLGASTKEIGSVISTSTIKSGPGDQSKSRVGRKKRSARTA